MNAPHPCPRCNAAIQAYFIACPQCGLALAPQQHQPMPAPYTPPYGQGAPQQPGAYGYPPPQQPQQPGYGAPPQGAYGPVAGMPPPDNASTGKGVAMLGGCGAAGCLGAVIVGVLSIAVVVIMVVASGPSTEPSAGTTAGTEPASPTTAGPTIPDNLPNHGAIRTLIRSQVGAYALITTAAVTKYPDLLLNGMVDSMGAIYRAPDGRQVNEMVLAYTSAHVARGHVDTVRASFAATYGTNIVEDAVRNKEGTVIGARVVVTESGGTQHVYWSNSNVLFIVTGNAPHAALFHQASPY